MLDPLRSYYGYYRLLVYLFEGQAACKCLHERGIQHFIQTCISKIVLGGKDYLAHTLHHSFATQLPDTGTDLDTIKELPGHSNLITTMIYVHLQANK